MNRRHFEQIPRIVKPKAIFLIAIAASACINLATPTAAQASGMISGSASDGLLFVVSNDSGMELWRARLADKALQQISATPVQEERWPVWSTPGKRIAYIARNTEGVMKAVIKTLNIETGKETGIGPKPDFVQRSHVWSPDGKSIAHTFQIPPSSEKFITDSGTVIVNLAQKNRVVVSKVESIQQRMEAIAFASDGQSLVAQGTEHGKARSDKLWILKVRQRPHQIKKIPRGDYASPRFTRDDKSVIFDIRVNEARPRDVMLVSLETKARARRVASLPKSDDYAAAPSPTRDEIVFVSDRDGSPDLFLANISGRKPPVNLTKNSSDADLKPVWSPDGERIAYTVTPAHDYQTRTKNHAAVKIRVIDRQGKLLFETDGVMPSWMPAWEGDMPVAHYLKKALAKNSGAASVQR